MKHNFFVKKRGEAFIREEVANKEGAAIKENTVIGKIDL